jgi:16S rRNA (guanine966-N2)-methyltransferase
MRVIAGRFRSRKLHAPPPGVELRPTSDRLRETLFNVVAPRTPDSLWLDLFSGTGAVGIEALSRGARFIYFVETDKKAVRLIRKNLEELGIEENFELIQGDVAPALRTLEEQPEEFDIVFLDPPYNAHGAYAQVLEFLAESELVTAKTWVIAEHDKHFDPGDEVGALKRFRELKQGDAVLSFYQRQS